MCLKIARGDSVRRRNQDASQSANFAEPKKLKSLRNYSEAFCYKESLLSYLFLRSDHFQLFTFNFQLT